MGDAEPLERSRPFRKAFKSYREIGGLSQQDIHNWGQAADVPLHNSQIAYLERDDRVFDPKIEFWFSLESFNEALSKEGPKGFRYVVKELSRERLQAAAPFMTHDGRVAGLLDFIAMFAGRQPINDLYTRKPKEKLTDSFTIRYGKTLEKAFNEIARELMLSKKEAWQGLKETTGFPQTKEYLHVCQDLLRGEHDLTKEETLAIAGEHKRCPCKDGLVELAGHPIPELEKATKELMQRL